MGRSKTLAAAGCVVFRPGSGSEPEVLLVHRPRYDDWTIPKGKLDPDEYLPGCAVRETWEESGVEVQLGMPVPRQIRYQVNSGEKTVWYWRASVVRQKRRRANAEVDKVRWLPISEAVAKVSYVDEMDLIQRAAPLPDTTPLVILRHTKAMLRANWTGRDQARPVDTRGRRQAELLKPLLSAYRIDRLVSSSSIRCVQTLKPYAKANKLEIQTWATLSEEQARLKPKSVGTLMHRIRTEVLAHGEPTVVCGHRPVLPLMFEALGVEPRPLKPGAALVLHLRPDGEVVAVEEHKPRV